MIGTVDSPDATHPDASPVVIVGAGPVGLTLALALAQNGIQSVVLEKNDSTGAQSRAPGIWSRSQEIFDHLGVLGSMVREGITVPRLELWDADRERTLLTLPIEELAGETPYPRLLVLPQSKTESLLLRALQDLDEVDVRFGCEVTGIDDTPSGAVVHYEREGVAGTLRASFVAGCDGAHSIVRETLGGSLEGHTYRMKAALADIQFASAEDLPFPRLTTVPDLAVALRMSTDSWRLILPFDDTRESIDLDRRVHDAVEALFSGRPYDVIWKSEFRLHRRISTIWSRGRVVLAGDAAHLNSPVGGQGMNAGILDAMLLSAAMAQAIEAGDSAPLHDYAGRRRRQLERGTNAFTDKLTRVLFAGKARLVRPVFRAMSLALRVPSLRRRFLRRLAMIE